MKKQRPEKTYLADIQRAAELAIGFAKGLDRTAFEKDLKAVFAILYQLTVIGEATKYISREFRSSQPDIPWKKMAGMRDVLIHAYHELDMDAVWKTVQNDLPELLGKLKQLLAGK